MVVVGVPAVVVVVVCWYGLLLFRWIIYSDGPNVNIIYTYLIYIYIYKYIYLQCPKPGHPSASV